MSTAVPRSPAGAGDLGTAVLTAAGSSWWYRWGRPQPGMLQTRFASLLPERCAEELHRVEHDLGVASIVGAAHPNPTVAVHDRADAATIGRVGAGADAIDGDVQRVVVEDGELRIVSGADGVGRPPVYDSVAAIATTDPLGRYLGALSMAQGWELLVYGAPPIAVGELDGATVPRVVLRDAGSTGAPPESPEPPVALRVDTDDDDAVVISPRRWTISVADLDRLRVLTGAAQYLGWREVADRVQLDDLVLLRWSPIPGSAEYLFPTTSPLAVRSLFDHLPAGDGPIVASELPGPIDRWPVRTADGHHLSELAVTWWRARDRGAASTGPP